MGKKDKKRDYLTLEEKVERVQEMMNIIKNKTAKYQEEITELTQSESTKIYDMIYMEEVRKIDKKHKEILRREMSIVKRQRSAFTNQGLLAVLKVKFQLVQSILKEVHSKLFVISNDRELYRKILIRLTYESLLKMDEYVVVLRCRKVDLELVKEILPDVVKRYREKEKKELKLILSTKQFLPPPPVPGKRQAFCSGGIVLSTPDGKIMCSNTLDQRLLMAFESNIPWISKTLFK